MVSGAILSILVTSFVLLTAYLPAMRIWSLLAYAVFALLFVFALSGLLDAGGNRDRLNKFSALFVTSIVVAIGFSLLPFFFIGAYLGEYSLLALLVFAIPAGFVVGNQLRIGNQNSTAVLLIWSGIGNLMITLDAFDGARQPPFSDCFVADGGWGDGVR